MPSNSREPKRIAILGGGLAGIATALQLTDPRNPVKCDVTVYQSGWRLGGKCASGRSGKHQLIEEHGLHILLGFYENTFRMIRQTMEEWTITPGHPWHSDAGPASRWLEAFEPAHYAVLLQPEAGVRRAMHLHFPKTPGFPGDGSPPPTRVVDIIAKLRAALASLSRRLAQQRKAPDDSLFEWFESGSVDVPDQDGGNVSFASLEILKCAWYGLLFGFRYGRRRREAAREEDFATFDALLDVGISLLRGLLANRRQIRRRSLDVLDDYDFREFLMKYGASPRSVRNPTIAALYDSVFASPGGIPGIENESLAAGAAIRSFLNIVAGYKGAPWWRMRAGMGDVVFTPAYEVLTKRGVKFRFFHRVERIVLSEDGGQVSSVVVHRQAKLKNGSAYDPLIPVRVRKASGAYFDEPLMCWPNEPKWDQLESSDDICGVDLERDTKVFVDTCELRARSGNLVESADAFDEFVLAIPIGAFSSIGMDKANTRIEDMVRRLDTVRTCSYQVWLSRDLTELGWRGGGRPILGNFIDPLNTWSDMSHLLPMEGTAADFLPRNISYFTGAIPDAEDQPAAYAERAAQSTLDRLLREHLPNGVEVRDLMLEEYLRVNVGLSERYVLTTAGTTRFRLGADESGIDNLKFAGDWTRNGFNVGAAEPTVMSAMQASNAISGWPSVDDIVRYNPPTKR